MANLSQWTALNGLRAETERNKNRHENYEKEQAKEPQEGLKEKREAIDKLITELEHTEKILIKAGAKPFTEMHPKAPKTTQQPYNRYRYKPAPETPYETSLSFQTPDLNHVKTQGYIELFEAAWNGDLERIKVNNVQGMGKITFANLVLF
jgi:hypothetical protein